MQEKCKNCMRPSKGCISFIMTLTTNEMLEWCRFWKERLGWSNAYLAELSKVPKGTIDRVLSLSKTADETAGIKLATIRPILCALTGCTIDELRACESLHDAAREALIEKNRYLEEDNVRLKREAENQHTFLASQLVGKDNQIRIKDRYIAFLTITLIACVIVIISALIIDKFNPNLGFIWRGM